MFLKIPRMPFPPPGQPGANDRRLHRFSTVRRLLATACSGLLLAAVLCAVVSAAEIPSDEQLRRIDEKRHKLLVQMDQLRNYEVNRMVYLTRSVEVFKDLCMLDYDDPRTPLGGALAMNNVSNAEITTIVYEMVLGRAPKEDELQRCEQHIAQQKMGRREAFHDIVWALCNSKEYIDWLKR